MEREGACHTMAGGTPAESLALAREERLGVRLVNASGCLYLLTFETRFRPEDSEVRLSGRVTEAHHDLAFALLRSLPSREVPDHVAAGDTLAVHRNQTGCGSQGGFLRDGSAV